MKIMRRTATLFVAMALMFVFIPTRVFASDVQFVIYHTNDIHGRAEGTPEKDEDGQVNDTGSIGYARYKEIMADDRVNPAIDRVLVLDAGDAVHGTLFAQLSAGENIIDLMQMVGVDAMACGNHEFGYGPVQLKELDNRAASGFPLMAANVKTTAADTPFFKVNHKEFAAGGKKIVVFGIATPETKLKAHPNYTRGLSFGAGPDEQDLDAFISTVQAVIDALRPGTDCLIMLGHLGVEKSSPIRTDTLIPGLSGLDLVIDGHSHTVCQEKIKDRDGREVLVVQTGNYFENIGRITVTFSDGQVSAQAGIISFKEVRHLQGDAEILDRIKAFNDETAEEMSKEIGRTASRLDHSEKRGQDQIALLRVQETNLGNLVADSMRKATGADLALVNGGGIRAGLEKGVISFGDAVAVLPFGNLITVIELTGRQILDALKHGAGDYPAPSGGFPQVSGLSYVIVTRGQGEEEVFVDVDEVMVGGMPLDPAKTYTLATSDFLAAGGDDYKMFQDARQVLLHGLLLEAFIDEIKTLTREAGEQGFSYKSSGRIRVRNLSELGLDIPTGESASLILSGMLYLVLAVLLLMAAGRKARGK